ncbi:MAG TPA: hypothetical protein VN180_09120 [Acidimicrobiia bacterium]|jgi:hypothetical protein|nr:hypothetical protein [Acidimicrobiia bacterium]
MRLLRWITWTAWRRRHGSRFWFYASLGAGALQTVSRLLREPEARTTLELQRGDAIEVRVVDADAR